MLPSVSRSSLPLAPAALAFLLAAPVQAQSITGLGFLPGGQASQAYGLSADGSTVVGFSASSNGDRAIRWTATGGLQDLGALAGGATSYSWGASSDGSIIVGYSGSTDGDRAFRWTS